MRITSVSSTYCFVTVKGRPAQVVRVVVAGAPPDADAEVSVAGPGAEGREPWRGRFDAALAGRPGGPAWVPSSGPGLAEAGRFSPRPPQPEGMVVEVPVLFGAARANQLAPVRARLEVGGEVTEAEAEVEVREPGWRMLMVSHFHYDPVWWNTQAGYTSGWDELAWAQDVREPFQHTGLALVEAHLQRARLDPGYKFVLAEVDYLKPFWDLYPDRREEVSELLRAGRLEVVGGTYNEPNTNLTGAETAVRAAVYGLGFQRDIMGASPQSAWQLDVFAHDPQFPGIMAECGLVSAALARGPFHQWGPRRHAGSNSWMQFPSEFEWVAPNGSSLLTCYMPNHYSAGWELEKATTLEEAMWRAYELFCDLAEVAATHVTLLPVGTDCTPPSRFVTDVARAWAARYDWPQFTSGLPKEFFAAVREELRRTGRHPSPQTRDMGPVYTGKDVSFIDTKQAQRLAESRLAEAEAMAAAAGLLGAPVPYRALDKAWRQLVFGAHHDGVTGSESDQVYLDLLAGWRESFELAYRVEQQARHRLVAAVDTSGEGEAVVVTNTLGQERSELVRLEGVAAGEEESLELADERGTSLPTLAEQSGTVPGALDLQFLAPAVPGVGVRTFRLRRRPQVTVGGAGWVEVPGLTIANEQLQVTASPALGGGLVSVTDVAHGFELVPRGEVANELVVYPEHPNHPEFGEGPWHLLPAGLPVRSRSGAATVRHERCALGERLVADGRVELGADGEADSHGGGFSYRQTVTLWRGARRLELRTELHGWAERDRLVRLRFPTTLAGATPLCAVGDAVVARSFGLIDADSAQFPWTLDHPAAEWFGLSTTLVLEASDGGPAYHRQSLGVAEVVTPAGGGPGGAVRDLVLALVHRGVTATTSEAPANRYGGLLGDSNLPDFRIAIGTPTENPFVAQVLEHAGQPYRGSLDRQLANHGRARLLVPAEHPLAEVWQPGADLRGPRDLPVLVVAGTTAAATEAAVVELATAVATGRVTVDQPATLVPQPAQVPGWTAALMNRGTPGFAVEVGGALNVSLLRACTGWPSGVWVDPPRRSAPDGSAFGLEHWSHVYDHALVLARGDWREAGLVAEAQAYNRPMVATLAAPHPGLLPPRARLFGLSAVPARGGGGSAAVVLAALKPAGNALASGDRPAGDDGPVELTLRCYEPHGQAVEVEVESWAAVRQASRSGLLEDAGEALPVKRLLAPFGAQARVKLGLRPGEIATVRLSLEGLPGPRGLPAGDGEGAGGPEVEVAQPVFSRYWLHNKGAAPMGNRSLAVHVLTTAMVVRAGDSGEFVAQVASGSARTVQSGRLELVGPDGWELRPPSHIFALAPGAYVQVPVRFRVPLATRPGRRFLALRASDDSGQVQEDVLTVDVLPPLAAAVPPAGGGLLDGGPLGAPTPFGHPQGQLPAELEASLTAGSLVVPAGTTASLGLLLANRTAGELRGEAQLVSPVETWPLTGPWDQGFALPPKGSCQLEVVVRAPARGWLSSWALFKVMYFGRMWYSPAVALHLGTAPAGLQLAASGGSRHA